MTARLLLFCAAALTAAALAGVICAGAFATQMPRSFLPPFNEGTLTINLLFNPGISLAESHRVGLIAERLIMEMPEVKLVGRRTGLANLLIESSAGWIPLRQIADIVETDGPNQILRENGKRRVVVMANAEGTADMAHIASQIRRLIAAHQLPPGYFISLEGTFQAQEESMRTIGLLSLVSRAMIFAILYSRYRSVLFVAIIMASVPLAIIGSVTALWLAGQPLSVGSMVGFITLTGIAARNGILKISHYINLAIHENMPFGRELVIRGSLERLTPVLMTALSAGFALIPLMIDPNSPGKEILHPVAVTIFGGLITATILDTVLTPTLFLRYGRKPLERLVEQVRAQDRSASDARESPKSLEAF